MAVQECLVLWSGGAVRTARSAWPESQQAEKDDKRRGDHHSGAPNAAAQTRDGSLIVKTTGQTPAWQPADGHPEAGDGV